VFATNAVEAGVAQRVSLAGVTGGLTGFAVLDAAAIIPMPDGARRDTDSKSWIIMFQSPKRMLFCHMGQKICIQVWFRWRI
jgi:hypothetical protein